MIAEAPISDAKAKSEARRAKILAREAARISASKNEGPKVSSVLMITKQFVISFLWKLITASLNSWCRFCVISTAKNVLCSRHFSNLEEYNAPLFRSKMEIMRLL